ncbi:Coenzyme F420 hydrogenase/dehydrogenase, beta subunit C-terminal domain [Candidatus Pyrohabitans sp.]
MKLAYVGLPCQLQALHKLRLFRSEIGQDWANSVSLTVGLFCRENWAYTCFRALIEDDYGVKLGEFDKFDIKKGKVIGLRNGEVLLEIPLAETKPYVRVGCQVCLDFSAELTDLSVGAVGSPAKYSTVIVRTKRGMDLLKAAEREGYVEVKHISEVKPGTKLVLKLTKDKRDENLAEAERRERAGYVARHITTLGDNNLEKLVEEAQGKTFADLERDVIDAGMCVSCGTCVAVARDRLEMVEERPRLKEGAEDGEITGAYLACPRTSLPGMAIAERLFAEEGEMKNDSLGRYLDVFAVKAAEKARLIRWQDGGAVTALLLYALKAGEIDGAIAARRDENWRPIAVLAKSEEELRETGGTLYCYVTNMPLLREVASK